MSHVVPRSSFNEAVSVICDGLHSNTPMICHDPVLAFHAMACLAWNDQVTSEGCLS